MIIALSWLFLRERCRAAVAGVARVARRRARHPVARQSSAARHLLASTAATSSSMLSMALWSIYTIGLRWRPAGLSTCCRSCSSIAVGRRPRRAAVLSRGERARRGRCGLVVDTLAALLRRALLVGARVHFWNRGVEQVGANVAGLFVHLMPVFGVVLAWLFLGERLRRSTSRASR